MTLRTPRRRISPRTKHRYRAIKDFFKKALGTSSQQDLNINSSIALNVTSLKHKIVGIESQLNEVNKHCRNLACLENRIKNESKDYIQKQKRDISAATELSSDKDGKTSTTKVLYRNSEKSNESECTCAYQKSTSYDEPSTEDAGEFNMNVTTSRAAAHTHKFKDANKRSKLKVTEDKCPTNLRKHKAHSAFEKLSYGFSNSFHSLSAERSHCKPKPIDHRKTPREYDYPSRPRKHKYHDCEEFLEEELLRDKKSKCGKSSKCPPKYEEVHHKIRKQKGGNLDEDFIADLIRRQYRPKKMFDKKNSSASQFSAPVCRDQEYLRRKDLVRDPDLCSCCYDDNEQACVRCPGREHKVNDMRSLCDTRVYSAKRLPRNKKHGRPVDVYNDAAYYDLIPVKEKTSPKTRRKFVEDITPEYHEYYREVPPSPRTMRPRLNLKARYYQDYDDYSVVLPKRRNRRYPPMSPHELDNIRAYESDITSEIPKTRRWSRHKLRNLQSHAAQVGEGIATMTSLRTPGSDPNNQTINDQSIKKTIETCVSIDKTDKALCEIKNILQNFLQEIKKDSPSQCGKSDIASKSNEKTTNVTQESPMPTQRLMNANGPNNLNCTSLNQFPPHFTNTCCYPVMPMYNPCMQNGFMMPSSSFSCQACNTQKETECQNCSRNKGSDESNIDRNKDNNDTEELIREIYKYVLQSPDLLRKKRNKKHSKHSEKQLTSRSVGGSARVLRNDAQVGTPAMKCYSKSCEAIGSRIRSANTYNSTNTTQSDTMIEKLSLDESTESVSVTSSSEFVIEPTKLSKFNKVLNSLRLFKKKKKGPGEDVSESESTIEVEVKPKKMKPYHQKITNYTMHGQEYYQRPPIPRHGRVEGAYGYATPYDPHYGWPPPPRPDAYTPHAVHHDTIPEHPGYSCHDGHPAHHHRAPPTAPPYSPVFDERHYHNHGDPNLPVCLKEIEVKSTSTQSDKKISFFKKMAKKLPREPVIDLERSSATQTKEKKKESKFEAWKRELEAKQKKDSKFAAWKKEMERKAKIDKDPLKFAYDEHKKLAMGDAKMRKNILDRLFFKKNPFSPRNLIVRTLMGKDPSSFGEPTTVFRPRMFF